MTVRKKKSFDRAPNLLRCYICQRNGRNPYNLSVSDDVVKRRRTRRGVGHSKVYDQVAVNCLTCGHQWYSMHKDAVDESRQTDANLKKRHGGQT